MLSNRAKIELEPPSDSTGASDKDQHDRRCVSWADGDHASLCGARVLSDGIPIIRVPSTRTYM